MLSTNYEHTTKPVRTRFAPSPTGYLHVGGVRTALFAWLVARQANGEFLLRIEDTDRARHVETAESHILESLKWLELNWDGEVYRQSDNKDVYKSWAYKLLESGRAYADPYTQEELADLRAKVQASKKPFLFREHRPEKTPQWDGSRPLRFKSEPKNYKWSDAVMGSLSTGPEVVDDFIIIKSDGFPTYNFAHIVDDYLMNITHVIRTQEFLPSVPNFLNLYDALAISPPILATLPYVMAPEGKRKLSKRDGAKDILDYKREGYLPEALISFLATLGWNDGTEQEIFTREELLAKFSLGRVQKSGAHFDEQRLLWMNGHYIRELSIDELYMRAEGFWGTGKNAPADRKKHVLALVQDRLKYLSELPGLSDFFFVAPQPDQLAGLFNSPVDKQLKALSRQQVLEMLAASRQKLEATDFNLPSVTEVLNNLLGELNTKPGILFAALRVALTGAPASPPIFDTVVALGKDEVLNRLDTAMDSLKSQH